MVKCSHSSAFGRPKIIAEIVPAVLEELGFEQVDLNGQILTRQCLVTKNPVESISTLHALDFCLDNQLAMGNLSLMRPVTYDGSSYETLSNEVSKFQDLINSASISPQNE